jgi:DNA-binding transcriptional ArsR family regulator
MQLTTPRRLSPDRLDATFAALADPTRRAILARLSRGDASVSELAAPFRMSQPAVSKHLRVLERAGLISRHPGKDQRDGRRAPSRIEGRSLQQVDAWLGDFRRFWEASFGKLDQLLSDMQDQTPRTE